MKIAVCDDNELFRNHLILMLEAYFHKKEIEPEIQEFSSGEEILCCDETFDLVFMDVEMGGISGTAAGKALHVQCPHAVLFIITSFDDYLDEAFDANAFRFLQKPIDEHRLYNGLDMALRFNRRITFSIGDEVVTLNVNEIICVCAERGKTRLMTTRQDYLTATPLNQWKERLYDDIFSQSHKSYIVNLRYVQDFDNHSVLLSVDRNRKPVRLDVSQRCYQHFRRDFFRVMEGRS